ncbi:DddA-like double-stranded DNA deaminase toxin [Kribbella deserti]|uniref:DddA-like double-stranded DNA deaminase toxin n=1 Tax=Kribbella deserti TaxID=1926257 RepID=A0ABV6QDS3_9ACTN
MPSDLERIAQGLIDYLDANPRMAGELGAAAAECQQLAAEVAELAVMLPEAAAAAEYLQQAANDCGQAAQLSARAAGIGRTWAEAAVGGGAGRQDPQTPSGARDANAGSSVGREDAKGRPDKGKPGPRPATVGSGDGAGSQRSELNPGEVSGSGAERERGRDLGGGITREIIERLPKRTKGSKTLGIWIDDLGNEHDLSSGVDRFSGPAEELVNAADSPIPREAFILSSHVEVKFAMRMRDENLTDEFIVINNWPCEGPVSCDKNLKYFLPPGARLTVFGPNNFRKTYPEAPTTDQGDLP